jgi:DNA polymerase-3 subunit gamma/tau
MVASEPSPPPRPVAPTVARSDAGDQWAEAVARMVDAGTVTALVRELAMQAQCVAIETSATEPLWRLRVEREMLRAPAHRDKLQAALAQHLQRSVRVEVEAGVAEDSPAIRTGAERERRQREAEQIIHNDPLVLALMAQYKTARIVPGSVKPH